LALLKGGENVSDALMYLENYPAHIVDPALIVDKYRALAKVFNVTPDMHEIDSPSSTVGGGLPLNFEANVMTRCAKVPDRTTPCTKVNMLSEASAEIKAVWKRSPVLYELRAYFQFLLENKTSGQDLLTIAEGMAKGDASRSGGNAADSALYQKAVAKLIVNGAVLSEANAIDRWAGLCKNRTVDFAYIVTQYADKQAAQGVWTLMLNFANQQEACIRNPTSREALERATAAANALLGTMPPQQQGGRRNRKNDFFGGGFFSNVKSFVNNSIKALTESFLVTWLTGALKTIRNSPFHIYLGLNIGLLYLRSGAIFSPSLWDLYLRKIKNWENPEWAGITEYCNRMLWSGASDPQLSAFAGVLVGPLTTPTEPTESAEHPVQAAFLKFAMLPPTDPAFDKAFAKLVALTSPSLESELKTPFSRDSELISTYTVTPPIRDSIALPVYNVNMNSIATYLLKAMSKFRDETAKFAKAGFQNEQDRNLFFALFLTVGIAQGNFNNVLALGKAGLDGGGLKNYNFRDQLLLLKNYAATECKKVLETNVHPPAWVDVARILNDGAYVLIFDKDWNRKQHMTDEEVVLAFKKQEHFQQGGKQNALRVRLAAGVCRGGVPALRLVREGRGGERVVTIDGKAVLLSSLRGRYRWEVKGTGKNGHGKAVRRRA
jgi:hypothetical protein